MSTTTTDPNTLTLRQGKTFRVTFVMNNSAPTPVPVSLTGYGATFNIYNRIGGTVLIAVTDLTLVNPVTGLSFASGDQPVVVQPNGNVGQVAVRLGADLTATLTRPTAYYDASVHLATDPTEVQPLASGPLVVLRYGDDGWVA